jgi:O-succinylbenzoate synthase
VRFDRAELRVVELPLRFAFTTSFGTQTVRHALLLTMRGDGVAGTAEGTMEVDPSYREETLAGAIALLRDCLLPAVLGVDLPGPQTVSERLGWVRGNRFALATVEMAVWDAWGRGLGVPLWQLLGGVRAEVPVGVSLGIHETVDATVSAVEAHLAQGYRRIKLKIRPGWDEVPLSAVRAAFPDAVLSADANCAYTLADVARLRRLDAVALDYLEQPLAWDDLVDHATLQRALRTPLCLDESIASPADARKALAIDACRVVNVKAGRVGGLSAARQVHDVAVAFGAPVWCGGMLETGVGRAHNLHLATLPGFTKPGDTASASRYWEHDVILEPLEAVGGMMRVPQGPGIGVTPDTAFIESITRTIETIKA